MNRNRMIALLVALCVLVASVSMAGAEPLELNEQLSDDALQIEMPEDDENLGIELDDAGEDFDDSTLEIDGLTLIDDPDVEALDQENLGIELPGEELELTGEDAAAQVEANAEEDVPIDEAHFPDETFRTYILEMIDGNEDGVLSIKERDRVTWINIHDKGSKNLVGIKLFTNLETLGCSYNQLTSLDVSGCTSLAYLFCNNNQLTSLDVSGLTNLKYVECYENMLKNVNVNGCTGLEELYCYTNQMTSLDVNGCVNLTNLFCYENELTHLNLYGCSQLSELACFHNHLTSLDISDCPILVSDVTKGTYETGISLDNVDYTYAGYYYRIRYDYWGTKYRYAYFRFDEGLIIFTTSPSAQLKENEIIMGIGEEISILSVDSPVPASDCSFGSYNPDVAEVDGNGVITGRRVGKTTITVTTNRGVKATCKVQVKKAPSMLELSRKDVILAEGDSFQLKTYLSSKSSSRITWTSSEDFVTVDDNGVVTAKKLGTIAPKKYATVKASTYNGLVAKCKVTVAPIPKSISFIQTALELGKKESWKMEAFVYPKGSVFPVNYLLKWTSSDEKVATVDDDGNIKARGLGKAKITARIKKGPKAVCTVTVKAAPGEIMLNKRKLTLRPYDVEKLLATLTKYSASTITWTSSNEQVATVDKEGNITARKTGTATITARTFNKKKAKCTVEVRNDNTVHYRALLIAEGDFSQHRTSAEKKKLKVSYTGAEAMQKMLKASVGPSGGKWETTYKKDRSNAEIGNLIRDVLGKAKSNDVSLFYITSHGDNVSPVNKGEAGAIKTTDDWIWTSTLASRLKKVRGKVIVIIDTCGSGAAIYSSNGLENNGKMKEAAKSFNTAVVSAFSKADVGLYVDENGNVTEAGETRSNAGELRIENKFYVLTACDAMEDSLSDEFVKCLTKGVNKKKMPADTNKDGVVTLNELYKYISSKLDNKEMKAQKKKFYQHVQVYPKNCEFGLFKRK